jgi:hypothetical protein
VGVVRQHLNSLSEGSTLFIRPANGLKDEDEEWKVNLLALQHFVRQLEMQRIIERKYGSDALRIVRIITEKNHIDPEQVLPITNLKPNDN